MQDIIEQIMRLPGRSSKLGYIARCRDLVGTYIRNTSLTAPFLAVAEGQPVGQRHALHAARREYQKLGKMVDESSFAGQR